MNYIAHVRKSDGAEQLVKDHLLEVKQLSEGWGAKIGVKHLAGLAGVLHDFGKYSSDFQEYLRYVVAHPDDYSKRGSVDHSTAGAKFLRELLASDVRMSMLVEIIGNAIISHHGGLNDYIRPNDLETPYYRRVYEKELSDFDNCRVCFFEEVMTKQDLLNYCEQAYQELMTVIQKSAAQRQSQEKLIRDLNVLTKYIFSCVIDADRTNTRLFEDQTYHQTMDTEAFFSKASIKLNQHLEKFKTGPSSQQPINVLRQSMSAQAEKFASKPSGIYQLSIPTGGGKTLASLRYGLRHAQVHQKERIIYVVPFTTIIEQNAQVIREIVGDHYLLEHHSNVIDDDFSLSEFERDFKEDDWDLKLAKDNWESPIILTTLVQYLNVFYSGGTRNVRRLHNLARATVIFDEVQAVPIKCLSLFNESVNFLKNHGKTSVILCTATQPALDYLDNYIEMDEQPEIIQDLPQVVDAFKRVQVVDKTKATFWNETDISNFAQSIMADADSLLIILNTKKAVRTVFQQLVEETHDEYNLFHLSTGMCPKHRTECLEEMQRMMNNRQKVICVSSQLIEAGVDISFDNVIRSLAGLDSIAQAAGRCNRHGMSSIREVYVINVHEKLENTTRLPEINRGASITDKILSSLRCTETNQNADIDLLQPAIMSRYFQEYFSEFNSLVDYQVKGKNFKLFSLLGENQILRNEYRKQAGLDYPLLLTASMKTLGDYFKVIDNQTTTIIVPYDEEAEQIIAELNGQPNLADLTILLKKAQQYSVNLYDQDKQELNRRGLLFPLYQGHGYYMLKSAYDTNYGVNLEGDSAFATLSL